MFVKIFGEIDASRLFVIPASKPRNFDLCVSGAVRRDVGAVFGDLCACGVFARAALSCISRGPVPVIRELHVRCACVCMFEVQSVASCACAVFFCVRWIDVSGALGMSASVESWSWQCLCFCACVSDLVFVRGWCLRWMFVVASAKYLACPSVFFF